MTLARTRRRRRRRPARSRGGAAVVIVALVLVGAVALEALAGPVTAGLASAAAGGFFIGRATAGPRPRRRRRP
jgi:hypothetical protein